MSALMDLLSMALLGIGTLFLLIGATGLLRLPDVFTRLHGASVTDTLGAGAISVSYTHLTLPTNREV